MRNLCGWDNFSLLRSILKYLRQMHKTLHRYHLFHRNRSHLKILSLYRATFSQIMNNELTPRSNTSLRRDSRAWGKNGPIRGLRKCLYRRGGCALFVDQWQRSLDCRTMYPIPEELPRRPLLVGAAPIIPEPFRSSEGMPLIFYRADRYVLLLVFSLLPGANFQWQFPRVETIVQRLLLRP